PAAGPGGPPRAGATAAVVHRAAVGAAVGLAAGQPPGRGDGPGRAGRRRTPAGRAAVAATPAGDPASRAGDGDAADADPRRGRLLVGVRGRPAGPRTVGRGRVGV